MEKFLGMLGQIKVLHWSTTSYAKHKALDELHGSLSDKVDEFIEVYVGKYKKQPIKSLKINMTATSDVPKLDKYLESERESLRELHGQFKKVTELQTIIDDMMASFDRALYLCNLS